MALEEDTPWEEEEQPAPRVDASSVYNSMVERNPGKSRSISVADDANAQLRSWLSPLCSSRNGEGTRYSGGTSTGSSFTSCVGESC